MDISSLDFAELLHKFDHMIEIDAIDAKILSLLQRDGNLSQRAVAEQVGLSQNACWRRMQRLHESGVIEGYRAQLDAAALGLDLTIFVMVRTRHHSVEWAQRFATHVASIPDVVEMHRIGGEWDYLLKVVTRAMSGYDAVYQRLTSGIELETVTGYFSMETLLSDRPLVLPGPSEKTPRGAKTRRA